MTIRQQPVFLTLLTIFILAATACGDASGRQDLPVEPGHPVAAGIKPSVHSVPEQRHGSAAAPIPKANKTTSCVNDVDTIQSALDAHYVENWHWPTAGGGGGDIVWEKLVPKYLDAIPASDATCNWQVNSSPRGTVCIWDKQDKGSACTCGSVCTGKPGMEETLSKTEPVQCKVDRLAIQTALDAYFAANERWPTSDGKPGLIIWKMLVPGFLKHLPATFGCKWEVNIDPLGKLCQGMHPCACCACTETLCSQD